jgi:hypothetical protein
MTTSCLTISDEEEEEKGFKTLTPVSLGPQPFYWNPETPGTNFIHLSSSLWSGVS